MRQESFTHVVAGWQCCLTSSRQRSRSCWDKGIGRDSLEQ